MKRSLLTLAAAATLATPAAAAPRLHGEAELAQMLQGRVARPPVDCIDLGSVRSSQIVDGTAIVYDAGRTLYVNRPRAGAEELDPWVTMVVKPLNRELCRIDVVQLFDTGSRFLRGAVFLGSFVPYEKVKEGFAR